MKLLLVFAMLVFLTFPYNANAEAIMEASEGGVRVVLHNTPCQLKEVSNLPGKAVWHENGKQVEGCWGPRPDAGVVVLFFGADKTVGLAPISAFKRVVGV